MSAFLGPDWFAGPGWVSTLSTRSLRRPGMCSSGRVKGSRSSSRFRSLLRSSSIPPQREGPFYFVELLQTERQHVAEAYAGLLLTTARHATEMLVQEAVSASVCASARRSPVPAGSSATTQPTQEQSRALDGVGGQQEDRLRRLAGEHSESSWGGTWSRPERLPAPQRADPRAYRHHREAALLLDRKEAEQKEDKEPCAWVVAPAEHEAGIGRQLQSGERRRRKDSLKETRWRGCFRSKRTRRG